MTTSGANVGPKVVKAAIAVVVLMVMIMVVMSYWGGYTSAKDDQADTEETTSTVETTATPEAEGEDSPEGGEEEAAEPESKGTVVVLIDGLNFRTGPSKSGDLISGLDKGVKLEYLETTDGWYKVRTSDGKVGYVSASDQYTELQQ